MRATLYTIAGTPNGAIAERMLEHKGIRYRRVELPQALHKPIIRMLGFAGNTVPALTLNGRKVLGTRAISRALEAECPDPPLFPREPNLRAEVEDAERWGEETLQTIPRRVMVWALLRDRRAPASFVDRGPFARVPSRLVSALARPLLRAQVRLNRTGDGPGRAALAELPAVLDQVDELIAGGVLDGDELTAADYQIGCLLRILMCLDDLRPLIEPRPAGRLALRACPHFPGRIGPVLRPEEEPNPSLPG
ncbi:MAG: glutathione S-transferase family protein [Solirubrobacterales bacterium]